MRTPIFLALLAFAAFNSSLEACTGLKLKAQDGSIVTGRTFEFGVQVATTAVVIPRGFAFTGTTPNGPGLKYQGKYGVVGVIAGDDLAAMDGMNEKGIAVGTFYFPGYAGYAAIINDNQSKALSPVEFPNWILTQFASLEELKAALPTVLIAPTVTKTWGTTPAPFHYIVYDKSGNSLVIEPIGGKLVTYDNKIGVFTNSPSFDWQMTNLRNYINLTPFNVKPLKVEGVTLAPFGQGSGMVGLPGDFTPPSRFVRAAIFSITAIPSKNSQEAVPQLFHILNQFDIPVGAVKAKENGIVYSDATLATTVKDPQALKYYFRTYENQTIHAIDLNRFDLNAKEVKKVAMDTSSTPIVDVSLQLK